MSPHGPPRAPDATYRVQLRNGLTLDALLDEGWLDHAHDLGATHLYLSPVLQATPDSTHGYDVTDPCRVDPALGGDDAFRRVAARAAELGMGIVVDIVPNHMSADHTSNRWWWDVLRNGPLSEHAEIFDVDVVHPEERLQGRIFLPVLGGHYGRLLDQGRFVVVRRTAELVVEVDGRPFPLEPASTGTLLADPAVEVGDDLFTLVTTSLRRVERDDLRARAAELRALDAQLAVQLRREHVGEAVDRRLARLNADPDALHELLEAQPYRLAHWRAARDLGYRRFFDVNDLIGVRVEDPAVFELTHAAIRSWVEDGLVQGLRVDHPDGLADPAQYLRRLRELAPDAWIVVEKILEPGEELAADWPVDGTTGYEVAELIGRWQLEPAGLEVLARIRDELVGSAPDGDELVAECKRVVVGEVLAADLNRTTDAMLRMCESMRRLRDVTRHEVHEFLREFAVGFPVYRSYVPPGRTADERDRALVSQTSTDVAERRPDLDRELIDLLAAVLTGELDEDLPEAIDVRTRVQQLTGPTMAKGKEDTAFYRDVRLVSRNEVGADPFAAAADAGEVVTIASRWHLRHPSTMTSLSTHDSKRSEDVRARLSVLCELGDEWATLARDWMGASDRHDQDGSVDAATRYLLLQTVVGAHPLDTDRLTVFAIKAVREAKVWTSWLHPDEEYESAVLRLARALTADAVLMGRVQAFVESELLPAGRRAAVVQKVLQLLLVGVPDLYWGSEDWLLRLVDPDNRVAPPLDRLRRTVPTLDVADDDVAVDEVKLLTVRALLQLRTRCRESLHEHPPDPLSVRGDDVDRVLAFRRGDVVVVATRWPRRGPLDPATVVELPPGDWRPALGGGGLVSGGSESRVADLVGDRAVAVLEAS